jgi:hypothetical protein
MLQIIAANVLEAHCGMVFEEILHRLPQVKTLKVRRYINIGAVIDACSDSLYSAVLMYPETVAPLIMGLARLSCLPCLGDGRLITRLNRISVSALSVVVSESRSTRSSESVPA